MEPHGTYGEYWGTNIGNLRIEHSNYPPCCADQLDKGPIPVITLQEKSVENSGIIFWKHKSQN